MTTLINAQKIADNNNCTNITELIEAFENAIGIAPTAEDMVILNQVTFKKVETPAKDSTVTKREAHKLPACEILDIRSHEKTAKDGHKYMEYVYECTSGIYSFRWEIKGANIGGLLVVTALDRKVGDIYKKEDNTFGTIEKEHVVYDSAIAVNTGLTYERYLAEAREQGRSSAKMKNLIELTQNSDLLAKAQKAQAMLGDNAKALLDMFS